MKKCRYLIGVMSFQKLSEILNSHGNDCEEYCFVECDAVFCGRCFPTFRKYVLPPWAPTGGKFRPLMTLWKQIKVEKRTK
jgi:hypothetical protein